MHNLCGCSNPLLPETNLGNHWLLILVKKVKTVQVRTKQIFAPCLRYKNGNALAARYDKGTSMCLIDVMHHKVSGKLESAKTVYNGFFMKVL